MNTIDEYKEFFKNVTGSFKINSTVEVHLLGEVVPGTEFGCLGAIGFTVLGSVYKTQYFLMTNKGNLKSKINVPKTKVMQLIAKQMIEGTDGLAVIDIRLPTFPGYDGRVTAAGSFLLNQ